jgi:cytochrome b6-f complex iron-sulfur subunit
MARRANKENPPSEELEKKVSRREALNLIWLASLGFLFVDLAGVTYLFSMPRFREGEFGGVVPVGSTDAIPNPDGPPDNYPKVKFWISNTEEGVLAIYKVCTHLGCLYGWDDQETKFICPCHGSQFTKDGTWIQGPAPRNLDRFKVQLVDPDTEEIVAQTNDAGEALPVPADRNVVIRVDTGAKVIGETHS